MNHTWHLLNSQQTLEHLNVQPNQGLSSSEHQKRLNQNGLNVLNPPHSRQAFQIFLEQIYTPMVGILIACAVIKLLTQQPIEASIIGLILLINILLGLYQELKAENTVKALQKMATPFTRVFRDGQVLEINSQELTLGDIILLEAGNIIPADARLIETVNLWTQESSLTGESLPVEKNADALTDPNLTLGDRSNMIYMGTAISQGKCTAVVVEIGAQTQLGKIGELLKEVDHTKTHLQKKIATLSIQLGTVVLSVIFFMVLISFLKGEDTMKMFLAGVAIAIAAIPEGLPVVLTLTLAFGAQKMLSRKALIRKLSAVETLGSITTICSDKTGTLTQNKMKVVEATTFEEDFELKNEIPSNIQRLLIAGTLCNDSFLQTTSEKETLGIGDPTETAILFSLKEISLTKQELEKGFPRIAEIPFDSNRKRMTTFHKINSNHSLFETLDLKSHLLIVKGAPEELLKKSKYLLKNEKIVKLTSPTLKKITDKIDQFSSKGLRLIGIAYKTMDSLNTNDKIEDHENELVFLGILGLVDPPRLEVKNAIEKCLTAGIRPIMITGDHPLTALSIAQQLGIVQNNDHKILTGHDLNDLSEPELEQKVEEVSVYARVSPEDKLKIVKALQTKGHIVAMTGDGVNDAPALKKSDIGVAMGITGTDVSKEASDIVILDDNFSTIVYAIEEGRTIYENIRKFLKYIITSNLSEMIVILTIQLLGMPLPMTTLQILWMNLVTDGVPGIALGLEPSEKNIMKRKPFNPKEPLIDKKMLRHVLSISSLFIITTLIVGINSYSKKEPEWQTMIFMTLTLSQLWQALAIRTSHESIFKVGLQGNPTLLWSVIITCVFQFLIVYTPFLQKIFGTLPLNSIQLSTCIAASTVVFCGVEIEKWYLRKNQCALT